MSDGIVNESQRIYNLCRSGETDVVSTHSYMKLFEHNQAVLKGGCFLTLIFSSLGFGLGIGIGYFIRLFVGYG